MRLGSYRTFSWLVRLRRTSWRWRRLDRRGCCRRRSRTPSRAAYIRAFIRLSGADIQVSVVMLGLKFVPNGFRQMCSNYIINAFVGAKRRFRRVHRNFPVLKGCLVKVYALNPYPLSSYIFIYIYFKCFFKLIAACNHTIARNSALSVRNDVFHLATIRNFGVCQ